MRQLPSGVYTHSTRIAHEQEFSSAILPEPLECINKSIPVSLRKGTLEKMYSSTLTFLDELKKKNRDHQFNSCKFPFIEMAYKKEHEIASKNVKKHSYVAEMASHLLYLKKQAIPRWMDRVTFISAEPSVINSDNIQEKASLSFEEENIPTNNDEQATTQLVGKNSIHESTNNKIDENDRKCESDQKTNDATENGIIIVLGMPESISDVQSYILTKEQCLMVNMPTSEAQFSYRINSETFIPSDAVSCDRCGIGLIPSTYYTSSNPSSCAYHAGKLRWPYSTGIGLKTKRNVKRWTCCEGERYSTACTLSPLHVFRSPSSAPLFSENHSPAQLLMQDSNHEIKTILFREMTIPEYLNKIRIMGIDCEMIYTLYGLSLARISIVGWDSSSILLDLLIRQDEQVIDYNSTYSGISEETFKINSLLLPIVSFTEAQELVLNLLKSGPPVILVGHSIENDLNAIRIAHELVIDTSVLFPHHLGLTYRYGLKALAERYLKEVIQIHHEGHSSLEDARASLDIFKYKYALDKGLLS